jgi:hypothetical protein
VLRRLPQAELTNIVAVDNSQHETTTVYQV